MKYYRYLIYKLYSWGLIRKSDTPVGNVVITLVFVHYVQILSLYFILLKLFPQLSIFNNRYGIVIPIFILVSLAAFIYFTFCSNNKCESYFNEFKDESTQKRKRGSRLVLSFLIGSICFFFLLLPILFGF